MIFFQIYRLIFRYLSLVAGLIIFAFTLFPTKYFYLLSRSHVNLTIDKEIITYVRLAFENASND